MMTESKTSAINDTRSSKYLGWKKIDFLLKVFNQVSNHKTTSVFLEFQSHNNPDSKIVRFMLECRLILYTFAYRKQQGISKELTINFLEQVNVLFS